MLESQFQSKLIKELKKLFPGCIVMKSAFHHDATRKKFLKLLNELRLKLTFEHWQMSLLSCSFFKTEKRMSILKNSFFTPLFIKGNVFFARRKKT